MKNKRVLFLLGNIWSMGKNKGLTSIARLLEESERDFDVHIFTTEKEEIGSIFKRSRIYKVDLPDFKMGNRLIDLMIIRLGNLILNLIYIYWFIFKIRKVDVIYCSSSVAVLATRVIRLFYGAKTIHRIYGTFLYPFLGNYFEFFKKYEEVTSYLFKADKYVITNDGTHGDLVAEYFRVPKDKIYFLRNGVSLNDFGDSQDVYQRLAKRYGIRYGDRIIVTVSRLVNWKRVDRVLKSFLNSDVQKTTLLIIGEGDQRESLELIADGRENVRFLGAIDNLEVQEILTVSNLFITLFDYSNIGNSLIEAMAYGVPVISLDSGDTKSLINEDSGGILISNTDDDDIILQVSKKINEFFNDSSLELEMKNKLKNFSRKEFKTWDERIILEKNIIKEL